MRPNSPNSFCNPANLPLKDKSDVLNKEKRMNSNDKRVSKMSNQSKSQLNFNSEKFKEMETELLNQK